MTGGGGCVDGGEGDEVGIGVVEGDGEGAVAAGLGS